jgi:hypothetical protein
VTGGDSVEVRLGDEERVDDPEREYGQSPAWIGAPVVALGKQKQKCIEEKMEWKMVQRAEMTTNVQSKRADTSLMRLRGALARGWAYLQHTNPPPCPNTTGP